ncbi:MAG: hypothetical protein MK085_14015, partial [Phycisphaerales bacterium]|nr:hypothetical protein [Phycisphaerales bacterium]
ASVARVSVPRPNTIEALLRPAFLERDLQLLREELDLDQFQAEITEALLDNYLEAFELVITPFKEGTRRYHKSRRNNYISQVLGGINAIEVDDAVNRTRDSMRRIRDEKMAEVTAKGGDGEESRARAREENEKWSQWEEEMVAAAQAMESRLGNIRERVALQMADSEEPLDADGLLALAIEVRQESNALREAFIEQLAAVLMVEADELRMKRFDRAMAMILRERELARGTLSGERMDLVAVARSTWRRVTGEDSQEIRRDLDAVDAMLAAQELEFAAAIEARREATIDREIVSIRVVKARDEATAGRIGSGRSSSDWVWVGDVAGPYEAALKAEAMASLRVRNMNLAMLDASTALLAEDRPDIARRYRNAALQRGFPADMRRRWAERALDAAVVIETLDADRFQTILDMHDAMTAEVSAYRENSVASRIEREPRRKIELIEMQFDGDLGNGYGDLGHGRNGLNDEDFLGPDQERYELLDDRVDAQLKAILLPEEYEMLPPRPVADSKSREWEGKSGGGKADAKGGAGRSRGAGKGGPGRGAGGKGRGGK